MKPPNAGDRAEAQPVDIAAIRARAESSARWLSNTGGVYRDAVRLAGVDVPDLCAELEATRAALAEAVAALAECVERIERMQRDPSGVYHSDEVNNRAEARAAGGG